MEVQGGVGGCWTPWFSTEWQRDFLDALKPQGGVSGPWVQTGGAWGGHWIQVGMFGGPWVWVGLQEGYWNAGVLVEGQTMLGLQRGALGTLRVKRSQGEH